jgi:hypothetical protein
MNTIVRHLADRLTDVVERTVGPLATWALVIDRWIPPLDKLFNARHVDRAVVQVVLDLGQVRIEESTVGADRVATQWHGALFEHVLLNERQGRRTRFFERDRRCLDLIKQP